MQKERAPNPLNPVSGTWFPRWLLLCAGLVLALAAVIIVVRNTEREEQRMLAGMKDRADVLIWAMEGSTRSFRRMGQATLLSLAEEMAKQPGIVYIAIVDASGLAFVHSDTALQGTTPFLPGFSAFAPKEIASQEGIIQASPTQADLPSVGRLVPGDSGPIFVVHKPFTPSRVFRSDGQSPQPGGPDPHAQGHGWRSGSSESGRERRHQAEIAEGHEARVHPGHREGRRRTDQAPDPIQDGLTIVVGIDASNFERELRQYRFETSLMAGLIVLAGFAGTGLLFFLQNYRISRRLLESTQAIASQVVHNLPVGLMVADPNGALVLANPKSREILRLTQPVPATLDEMPCYDWSSLMAELDRGPAVLERETEFALSRTTTVPVSLSALAVGTTPRQGTAGHGAFASKNSGFSGYLLIFGDLGEVRRLQKEVRRNERLSALGNLAAGVAHEIRNPLSSIKGYATYLAAKLHTDAEASASCQLLIAETERLNRVVSELLGMTRQQDLLLVPVAPEEFVQTAVKIIGPDAEEKNIGLLVQDNRPEATAAREKRPLVLADRDKMVQVLLNLLLNAVQASQAGGTVQIVLENAPASLSSGGQLAISITDTGCGMSAETLGQLFTPYFTTKASGTGLGLVMAHGLMEQHGGEIKVASRQGVGTTFTLFLPFARDEQAAGVE